MSAGTHADTAASGMKMPRFVRHSGACSFRVCVCVCVGVWVCVCVRARARACVWGGNGGVPKMPWRPGLGIESLFSMFLVDGLNGQWNEIASLFATSSSNDCAEYQHRTSDAHYYMASPCDVHRTRMRHATRDMQRACTIHCSAQACAESTAGQSCAAETNEGPVRRRSEHAHARAAVRVHARLPH